MKSVFRTLQAFLLHNGTLLIALLLLVVCVFLPPREQQRPSYSFMVTFDISQSMNVPDSFIDGQAATRLEFAQRAAAQLLEGLPCGSRIGWSIFTGRRVLTLLVPTEVCEHYEGLLAALSMIGGQMRWGDASGIGKGLHQSMRAVDEMADGSHVVFMTDGHEAPPLRAGSRGMPATGNFQVDGIIAGIGGTTPARIPKLDASGEVAGYWTAEEVVQRQDENGATSSEELSSRRDAHLANLARLSQLHYLPADHPEQFVKQALSDTYSTPQTVSVDMRWIPASIALILLLWRFRPTFRRI